MCPNPCRKFAHAAHVDREEPFLQGCCLEEVAVGLVGLGGAGADGLEVVAEFEELLEEFLGLDRIRFEDLFLEGRDTRGGVPDEVLEGAHHLSPDRGDQFERVRRAEVSAVEAAMDGVELASCGVAG